MQLQVTCLTCAETFHDKRHLKDHARSGEHQLSCLHAHGEQRKFQSVTACLQHLANSTYHKINSCNAEENPSSGNGKTLATKDQSKKPLTEDASERKGARGKSGRRGTGGNSNKNVTREDGRRKMAKERNETKKTRDDGKGNATTATGTKELLETSLWTHIMPSQCLDEVAALRSKVHSRRTLTENLYRFGEESSPQPCEATSKLSAVVLACDMVATEHTYNELIGLTAIDYLTGEILIDTLVKPKERVTNWRSKVTGLTPAQMALAEAKGDVLGNWEIAREKLWKHVDNNTVLVGQALNNDFKALRITHVKVVDLAILTAKVLDLGKRRCGLRTLCEELSGAPLQNGPQPAHNSLQNAFLVREGVLWCLHNEERLTEYGISKMKSFQTRNTGQRSQRQQKYHTIRLPSKSTATNDFTHEDEGIWRWQAVAEDYGCTRADIENNS